MNKPSQETINRALLGDPDAAKECTDNGVAIQCPVCSCDDIGTIKEYECYSIHCPCCGETTQGYNTEAKALSCWNTRTDLRDIAKELYAPKWISCESEMPRPEKPVLCFGYNGLVKDWRRFVGAYGNDGSEGIWYFSYSRGICSYPQNAITHWMPLPDAPDGSVRETRCNMH